MIYGIDASQPPPAAPPASPAQFIAVGNINFSSPLLIATSNDDGTGWIDRSATAATASSDAILQGIAYSSSLDRWVAVGSDFTNPRIIYSDDGGNSWTVATADPSSDFVIYGICWTGSTFIAVGANGSGNPIISTSSTGITWTQKTSDPASSNIWHGVAGISGLALAVGGVSEVSTPAHISLSSDDGGSWTSQTAPATDPYFYQGVVAVSAGTHVAVGFGAGSAEQIATSTNGTAWTHRIAGSDHALYGIAWNGTTYVAVGMDFSTNLEARILTSIDGTTTPWTDRTADPSTNGVDGINLLGVATNSAGGFIAVGRDNNAWSTPFIMYSATGSTWTARTCPTSNCMIAGVAGKT